MDGEAKGICTDKGDLNRWVRSANAKLNNIRQIISKLLAWLKEINAELSKPQEPLIVDLLGRYFAGRNAGAWSQKAKLGNLKPFKSIRMYVEAYRRHSMSIRVISINILGNLAAFMPCAIFMPVIFKKMRKFRYFLLAVTGIVILAETIQFLTMVGQAIICPER